MQTHCRDVDAARDVNNVNRDTVEDAEATGGVIDGGTWEHRKRAKEMLKTAEGALNVTLQAKGAHHMGQYLPKDVSRHQNGGVRNRLARTSRGFWGGWT